MAKTINLTIKIGNLTFKNPVTVASGTFGSKDEYAKYVDYAKLGAIVTKTVTRKPRKGNPMPRIFETPSGMLNAIGLQNKGIDDFIEYKIPYFKKVKTHLIVNIAGESVEDFVYLAKKLDPEKSVSALELNISCPNVKKGLEFCAKPELAYEVVKAVKEATKHPIFTKLSPEAHDFLGVADSTIRAGSDGLSLINTIRGMAVDIEKCKPQIANVFGGLSGPAIRPIALRYLHEVKRRFDIPVMAMGGIMTAQDALEFLITGAHLISVGTANFVNPKATMEILEGIETYMKRKGHQSIDSVRGTLKVKPDSESLLAPAG
ncbi:MAG: dihydroorotate dehydrogenase B catalytic subunit [Omnitrophica bacterium RIFCSPHIGHO2_02_FULL_46_11]|nr:MAG: dihydroorotate dehydrogenase B catalytic subunit [Omnitrophica bacterium RIFCSPLOWO2_01_FULL_45_10b]OGW86861.1 MAG: dihydroorotate dehydrogenase B catalytic subunit [Omnitrophica bacterium RIFCSPHIGHO2_02_FULL_46_11]